MSQWDDVVRFFDEKQPWSKYKDLILDYYLKPYLAKVATLGSPIAVVDCFAGAGKFEDGEPGSPLIISQHLADLAAKGRPVRGVFIESHPELHARLEKNLANVPCAVSARRGDFHVFVDELVDLARTHTIFLYLDPIKPSHLAFDDLAGVYEHLRGGRSVETLVNFLSTGFVRSALALRNRVAENGVFEADHPDVRAHDAIAGGTYWQDVVSDGTLEFGGRIERIAQGYKEALGRWFPHVLNYPIREKYDNEAPKYHLVFGSRHPHGVELMNRAMVTARREFVGAFSVDAMLFPNQPVQEVVRESDVERVILEAIRQVRRTTWGELRVTATLLRPCMYLDTDFNRAIKRLIVAGRLGSTVDGTKKEDKASVWARDDE